MELKNQLTFDEFPKPSYEEWKEEAIKSLKGADFDKKLLTETFEGIILKPIYNIFDDNSFLKDNTPGSAPFIRGDKVSGNKFQKWEIAQIIPYHSPIDFNNALKKDLASGQTAINIHVNRFDYFVYSESNIECGLHLASVEDLEIAFDGIDLTSYPIYFNTGDFFYEFADIFFSYLNKIGIDKTQIHGNLGADFFGETLINGGSHDSFEAHFDNLGKIINMFEKELPNFGVISINSNLFHNSGASAIQELSFGFSQVIEIINNLLERGLNTKTILKSIRFSYAVSSNFFMEISKLRAARVLWSLITNEYSGKSEKMQIHCSTSIRNKTKYDPWVNILRNSIETLAAILGNANSIEVGNFDFTYGIPGDFSRRISRNIQLVLSHEAHLADTVDPTSGSYFVENLTQEIIRESWELIKNIESQNGFTACIYAGTIQNFISVSNEKQIKSYTSRRSTLLGTNKYPNLNEKLPKDYLPFSFKQKPHDKITRMEVNVPPIQITRYASPFEKLRSNADNFKVKTGKEPQIILMNFGELNEWKPRNDFASDFLQVGGFELINSPVFKNAQEAIDYKPEGPHSNIFAICSSDLKYEEILPTLIPAVKKQVKDAYFILAGFPEGKSEEYKTLGINEFIHLKADIYSTLEKIQIANNIL